MKKGFTLLLLILLLCTPDLAHTRYKTKKRQYINLVVGLTQDFKLPYMPSKPKFEGNFKNVASLRYAADIKTLRFNPKKPGTATLTIQDQRNRVIAELFLTVRTSSLNKIAQEIKAVLADIEGIDIKILNNKVVVDGQVLLSKDVNRVYNVISQYGNKASSIVTLSPIAQKKYAEYIERDINNPAIHVRSVNGKFIIEGVANSKAEKQRSEIIAKTYTPDIVVNKAESDGLIKKVKISQVINLLGIKKAPKKKPGKMIQLVVHFVELKKEYQKGFRFNWSPEIGDNSGMRFGNTANASSGISGIISSITGTISNLFPKLNWAKQHGYARVLQSSSVIVQDGKKGVVESVTQVPYQVLGANGVPGTNFAKAGLVSHITPNLMGGKSDSIKLAINFKVSNLMGVTQAGPLISERTINTIVVVRSRESAAIGGLVTSQSNTGYNKAPKGGNNPLFSLYASKEFNRDQSQFVVFITPVIKASASEGSEKIKQKFRFRQ